MSPVRACSGLLALTALCAAATASAQTQSPAQEFCGRQLRVESERLSGASPRAIPVGAGAPAYERVETPRGAVLVLRMSDDAQEPRHAVVLHCGATRAISVVWQGSTRWLGEDIGNRARDEVLVRDLDGDRQPDVWIARRHEARVCGVGRPILSAHRVDLVTGRLAPAEVSPLAGIASSASAERTMVTAVSRAPTLFALRRVVAPTRDGAIEPAPSVADGNPNTAWTAGRGAFLSATLPSSAFELRSVELSAPRAPRVMPRRWGLFVDPGGRHYRVEIPANVPPPGANQAVRVTLPAPVRASCFSLVPEDVTPNAALADLAVRSAVDDGGEAAFNALVAAADGPDGDPAALLLVEMGAPGAAALANAVATMTTVGARRAVRLLARSREPVVIAALVAALARDEVAEAASEALLRNGAPALEALSSVVATNPRASAVIASFALPVTTKMRALLPALHAEGDAWRAARAALTSLLAQATRERRLDDWVAMIPDEPKAAGRALRLTAENVPPDDALMAQVAQRARALWASQTAFEHRYRVMPALVGDEEGRATLAGVIRLSDDADLRAEAARALGRHPGSTAVLLEALDDDVPHVRAAVARALRGHASAVDALTTRIHEDPWPTVRIAIIETLAREPRAVEAVTGRLGDSSYTAVRAAIAALGVSPGGEDVVRQLVAFADEARHAPDLRRDAVDALGARCDRAAVADLERLAESLSDPALPPYAQEIAQAAMAAMARVDPERARAFLTRNQSNAAAGAAVERAIRQGCARP